LGKNKILWREGERRDQNNAEGGPCKEKLEDAPTNNDITDKPV